MRGFCAPASLAGVLLALAACGPAAAPPPQPQIATVAPREQLNRLVERYWDGYSQLNPLIATATGDHRYDDRLGNPISEQYLADSLALERRALTELLTIPEPPAGTETRLNYDIFKRGRQLAIEGFTYPSELFAVNPYDAMPQRFALMACGAGPQAFETRQDYENWLARIGGYLVWTKQAILNLRDGIRRGYTLPPELVEEILPQLASLAQQTPDNVFYQPLRALPASIVEPARAGLAARYSAAVREKLLPAYGELHDFLQNEYLPVSRGGVPFALQPLGRAWYDHLVREQTGGLLAPHEIHRIGLAETERIQGRVRALLAAAGFPGDPAGFAQQMRADPRRGPKSGAALLSSFADLVPQISAAISTPFGAPPRAGLTIRAVEAFREAAAPAAFYAGGTADGGGPSILYVNTLGAASRAHFDTEALILRLAMPGHHYQYALQRENEALPRFRRFGSEPAFVEGWALYAEAFGEELGLYPDAWAQYGALMDEWREAAALVVDTGLHAEGWNRRRALDFLQSQMPFEAQAAVRAVDRSLALPGQALAAKVGELRIRALRLKAEQKLGPRFQLAAFHREILRAGAMPLDLLEDRIKRWADSLP